MSRIFSDELYQQIGRIANDVYNEKYAGNPRLIADRIKEIQTELEAFENLNVDQVLLDGGGLLWREIMYAELDILKAA